MTSACSALSAPPQSCSPRRPSLGQNVTLGTPAGPPRPGWPVRPPGPACALPASPLRPAGQARGSGAREGAGARRLVPRAPRRLRRAGGRAGGGVMSRQGGGAGAAGRREAGEVFSSFKKAGGRARPCVRARLRDSGLAGTVAARDPAAGRGRTPPSPATRHPT